MNAVLTKFKLDSHHKIERFGVIFVILLVGLMTTVISTYVTVSNNRKLRMTNQVIYTQEFTTSQTQVTGNVAGIYTDDNHTKAFIMLQFSDVTNISTNANSYTVFLQGSSLDKSPTELNIHPMGSVYMFGTTGYMGLYLTDSRGFDNQILRLVVRGNANINSDYVSQDGDSFDKFDQLELYFNPGGADSVKAEFLNSTEAFTANNIYEELIIRPREEELRTTCAQSLMQMKTDMDTIAEYSARVKEDGIALTDPPSQIIGDNITDIDGNILGNFEISNKTISVKEDTVLYLNSEYTCVNGVDYDWQDKHIRDGILKDLTGNVPPLMYLSQITNEEKDPNGADDFEIPDIWYRTSGEVFEADSLSSVDTRINTDITNLTQAWTTYYKHKEDYQTGCLMDILLLEFELLESEGNFSINNSENVLQFS